MGGGVEHMFDDIAALAERMKVDGVLVTTNFPLMSSTVTLSSLSTE